MDAMQNDSATKVENEKDAGADVESVTAQTPQAAAEPSVEQPAESSAEPAAEEVPPPRNAEPEPAASTEAGSGKAKKRKAAPKAKTAGTKSLVVFREGKVHYADETVVVLDLDDAAHPDTDVHDVVDKLSELRDAIESSGRSEAVSLVAELIQAKALA